MGYTHYWKQTRAFTALEWKELRRAIEQVLNNSPCELGDGAGEGTPEITDGEIVFNGKDDDRFETMCISQQPPDGGGDFCKTGRRNYDTVVIAVLVLAENIAPDMFKARSDGEPEEWQDGLDLARRATGFTSLELPADLGGKPSPATMSYTPVFPNDVLRKYANSDTGPQHHMF